MPQPIYLHACLLTFAFVVLPIAACMVTKALQQCTKIMPNERFNAC